MIGGQDIVIPAVGDATTLEACARVVQRCWPHARFEDAETGDKFDAYWDIPFGRVRELFAYSDQKTEAAWDEDRADAPPNSMLYLILSAKSVTVVLDDARVAPMETLLQSIRFMMRDRLLEENYAEAA